MQDNMKRYMRVLETFDYAVVINSKLYTLYPCTHLRKQYIYSAAHKCLPQCPRPQLLLHQLLKSEGVAVVTVTSVF